MIFHFKKAQHLIAENYERFSHDFPLYGGSKRGCRALWKRIVWLALYSYDKMNKNGFNLVDSVLGNFTRKKARRF